MIDRDFPWPNDFDFKPASSGPGFALAPGDISIDVGKAGPMAIIAKHFPGERRACLGKDCVLQILHLLLLPRTGFNEGTGPGKPEWAGTDKENNWRSPPALAGMDEKSPAGAKPPRPGN